MNFRKLLNTETVVILLIMLVSIYATSVIQERNGRINQCNDMGMVMTDDWSCVTCESTGREWFDGNCIINPFKGYGDKDA